MNKSGSWMFRALVLVGLALAVSCAVRPMPQYEQAPTLPQVSGRLAVPGLQGEVKVYRDRFGVPHIFTENEHDLFFADGYVQAQDRLWQMELFRALATGRLAELFGEIGAPGLDLMGMTVSTVDMDQRMRIMGMNYLGLMGEQLLAAAQPDTLAQIQAYCDGINAFIDQNRGHWPLEFQILYLEPEKFRPADVISLSRFEASMLTANLDQELLRYALIKKFGQKKAYELMPLHDFMGPTVVPKEMLKNRLPAPRPLTPDPTPVSRLSADAALLLAQMDRAVRAAAFFPSPWASNNWVVGPKLTATGTAMLANDPHLVHLEPSLCYALHLKGAGYDAYGVAFPGQPYVVMGHTRRLAWGATVTGADTQDLFIETTDPAHPGKYLYRGEWKDFVVRKEVIKIRPGTVQAGPDRRFKEKTIEIRHTVHGPVINDMVGNLPKDTPPLALRWVGWDFSRDPQMILNFLETQTLPGFAAKLKEFKPEELGVMNEAVMFSRLMKGQGVADFVKAMEMNVVLNMNWVAADADGHIAYLPGGLVPIRKKGLGAAPVPGEQGEYDWTGFIPLSEVPQALDPERGYMATANNQVVNAEWYPYPFATNYDDGWRAWRIEELIKKYSPITVDKMRLIQNDVHVKQAEIFAPLILKAVEVKGVKDPRVLAAAKILREWNFEATVDSPAASIFYDAMKHLPDRVLEDDFPKKDYEKLIQGNASQAVQMWVVRGQSEYFDDRQTPNQVEDVNDALVGALGDAVKWLSGELGPDPNQWQWGKIHTLKWYHPMGFGPLKDMSIGPFPHPGGSNTVRNATPMGILGQPYRCFGGPVMRHIMDMGDPDHALLVIDGSQSGQWLSPHYRDQHTLFYNGQYLTAEMRPDKIAENSESLLVLAPK